MVRTRSRNGLSDLQANAVLRHVRRLASQGALQAHRTIEAIELGGSPETEHLLKVLAGGASSASLTRDAGASLR